MPPRKRRKIVDTNDGPSTKILKCSSVSNQKDKQKKQHPTKVTKHQNDEIPRKIPATKSYNFWLMKSEPETRIEKGVDVKFGIEDLMKEPKQTACWDGVRNYQARNFMRDQMKKGQQAFFYHSNCKEPGIAGIVEIVKEGYPDHTQFDKKDIHFDISAKKEEPRWFMVDVQYKRHLKRYISLAELKAIHLEHKANGGPMANVSLFTKARLSVQPLTEEEWKFILSLEEEAD